MSAIGHLRAALRLDDWWYSKAAGGTAVALSLALVTSADSETTIRTAMLGLIAIAALAAWGFGINDVADAEADLRSGRPRRTPMTELNPRRALYLLAPLVPIGIAAAWTLGIGAMAVEAAGFLVAAAYSVQPVRLKERGFAGVVAGGCGERLVPTALYLAAFPRADAWSTRLAVGLLLWSVLAGIRGILVHQILDAANDRRGGLRTWVTIRGEEGLRRIIKRIVWPAEAAAFTLIVSVLIDSSGWVMLGLAPVAPTWFRVDPHRHPRYLGYRTLALTDLVYRVWWPLAVVGALVIQDPRFVAAGAAYLLLFRAPRWRGRRFRQMAASLRGAERERAARANA